jgi:hypothetical protein
VPLKCEAAKNSYGSYPMENIFCRPNFKTVSKIKKTEFFQNFIFFSKNKDEVIFGFKLNLVLSLTVILVNF